MGLFGGFLGWNADDARLPQYQKAIREAGINIKVVIHDIKVEHPNTYKITLKNHRESHELTALSVGGGMIEVIAIDGAPVNMAGDYFETLIYATSFAAEVGGCQAECGAGSGMAAAGLVALAGGTLAQCLSAASLALQNSFGMVCDPVANRVEAPCLGKNVMAASNALACANMALADYDHLIPLDEVIDAMNKIGRSIPNDLCCTALGGLSITKTSKQIEKKLEANKKSDLQVGQVAGKFKVC